MELGARIDFHTPDSMWTLASYFSPLQKARYHIDLDAILQELPLRRWVCRLDLLLAKIEIS
jgi:hypothetical protein